MSIASPLLAILADPAWLTMDATARGYHIQLLLVAAQRTPAGTLPGHEATLRRYLGLGSARVKAVAPSQQPQALAKFVNETTSPLAGLLGAWWLAAEDRPAPIEAEHQAEAWAEHLWLTRWRPMVMEGWQEVDDTLIAQFPYLERARGGYYSAVAAGLASVGSLALATGPVAGKGAKKTKNQKRSPGQSGSLTQTRPNPFEDPALLVQGHDVSRWHDEKEVFSRWQLPMDDNAKRSLWDLGVAALTGPEATTTDKSRAKALLGKLIRLHGEAKVGEAVGALAIRAVPVADASAFLSAMLRNKEEGSPLEQKARAQRARVAL